MAIFEIFGYNFPFDLACAGYYLLVLMAFFIFWLPSYSLDLGCWIRFTLKEPEVRLVQKCHCFRRLLSLFQWRTLNGMMVLQNVRTTWANSWWPYWARKMRRLKVTSRGLVSVVGRLVMGIKSTGISSRLHSHRVDWIPFGHIVHWFHLITIVPYF